MPGLTEEQRQRLQNQRRDIIQYREMQFKRFLDAARQKMPKEAEEPLFEFVVRMLTRNVEIEPFPTAEGFEAWSVSLPDKYKEFCSEYRWLLGKDRISGKPSKDGIEALARLLVTIRNRQRWLFEEPIEKSESNRGDN